MVDDHPLVRLGLRGVLETQSDLRVVGEASDGRDALAAIPKCKPDVVVCDFHLPGWDGLEVTRRLLAQAPETKILIVSVIERGAIPRCLLTAGAMGYVSKAQDGGAIIRAIREVAAGRRFLDDSLGVGLLFEVSPFDYLSSRQLEVARLMVQGKRTGDIALELGLTESTVRTVRTTVMAKLRVRSDIALVRLAMVWGLIPVPGDAEADGSHRG